MRLPAAFLPQEDTVAAVLAPLYYGAEARDRIGPFIIVFGGLISRMPDFTHALEFCPFQL